MLYYLYNTLYEFTSSFLNTKTSVDKILPNLWLGNYKAAHDINFLIDNKIDMIINCTSNIPFIHEIIDKKLKKQKYNNINSVNLCSIYNIEQFRIPVNDSLLERDFIIMENYFKIVVPLLLRKHTIENKNILIHCHAGKQRSTIVTAALIKVLLDHKYVELSEIPKTECQLTQFQNICNYIRSKRPQVFTYGLRINFESSYKNYFNIGI
jgi:protein tyrosine/serine phosphatase